MMKKLLFCLAVMVLGTGTVMAQSIGILGGSTSVDWESDLDMITEDNVTYTYQGLVIEVPAGNEGDPDPGVKFRQDDAWTLNWGGTGFPNGTGALNGDNIPATNGTYDVTFNLSTLEYTFVPSGTDFDDVTIMTGEIVVTFDTADGVDYYEENVTFEEDTDVSFMVNDSETGWGSSSFPSGTAVEGNTIPVPANSYNIDFNLETQAYSFDFVTISLVGTGVFPEDPNWGTDLNLTTTNGVDYSIDSFDFPGGGAKFRLNNDWGQHPGWGSADFPSGTATTEGGDLNIPAGTYSVSFNRETGQFAFDADIAGLEEFASNSVKVYPNPTQNVWNFTASQAIDTINVVDISGKVVYSGNGNVVDASGLASGIYFARVASGNAVNTVKIVKN